MLRSRIGRSSLTLAVTFAMAMMVASSANASSVLVTYNINVNIGLPALSVPTTFNGAGQLTVRFANATSGGHVSAGNIVPISGFAALTASFTVLGDTFTGFQNIVFLPGGGGSVSAGGLGVMSVTGHVASGVLHCTGTTCALASLPASIPVPLTSSTVPLGLGITLAGFPSLGPQTFAAAGPAGTFAGQTLTATVTGVEVSRIYVPEPTSGAMLGLGLLFALGIGGGAVRMRR